MCLIGEGPQRNVSDQAALRPIVRSHDAAERFAGLPIAQPALAFASARHAGQYREIDRAPFIAHPIEVGWLLRCDGQPDEVVAAGLLHDLLEKTPTTSAERQVLFGARIAWVVETVSDDPSIADYSSRKRELRDRVARAGRDTVTIFVADKISKARELAQLPHHDFTSPKPASSSPTAPRASGCCAEWAGLLPSSTVSTLSSPGLSRRALFDGDPPELRYAGRTIWLVVCVRRTSARRLPSDACGRGGTRVRIAPEPSEPDLLQPSTDIDVLGRSDLTSAELTRRLAQGERFIRVPIDGVAAPMGSQDGRTLFVVATDASMRAVPGGNAATVRNGDSVINLVADAPNLP